MRTAAFFHRIKLDFQELVIQLRGKMAGFFRSIEEAGESCALFQLLRTLR
jgi:hypothetical protein